MNSRCLIVNADDFGLSAGVNRGIIHSHRFGIVTSASLMIRGPALDEAVALARQNPCLSIGLHIDLGEWVCIDDSWQPAYEVVPLNDPAAVQVAVDLQLAHFRQVMGQNPTHLDSHQHVHRSEPVRTILVQMARRLGIPLRSVNSRINYCGSFYGQSGRGYPYPEGISIKALLALLHQLPVGITELGCHPGLGADLNSTYNVERGLECQTLCDPCLPVFLSEEKILLCSFANMGCEPRDDHLAPCAHEPNQIMECGGVPPL